MSCLSCIVWVLRTIRETVTEPKWKLAGSHTARRSFTANAYLSGVPTISIMKMTGHKTESSFMKYIKITLTGCFFHQKSKKTPVQHVHRGHEQVIFSKTAAKIKNPSVFRKRSALSSGKRTEN